MNEKTKFSFSAANNSNILIYNNRKPWIIPLKRFEEDIKISESNKIIIKRTDTIITEYNIEDDIYIHALNFSNDIKLSKIQKFYKFQNLSNMFEIQPYSTPTFFVSCFNSLIDSTNKSQNIFYENENEKLIKRNYKILGTKINEIDKYELNAYLGYLIGVFLGRGYIEKKDRNLKDNAVIIANEDTFEFIYNLLSTKLHLPFFHKNKDQKNDYFTILDNEFNLFINKYFTNKKIPDWFYSSPNTFLNGFIQGIFQTNGTITFNKTFDKSFATFKIATPELGQQIIELLLNRYGLLSTFSLIPDKIFCKISVKLTKDLHEILESGFNYGLITNENKKELIIKSKDIFFQTPAYIPYKFRKTKCIEGYNFNINQSKGFLLNNGLFISSILKI